MCTLALPKGVYREEIVFTPEEADSFGRVRSDALARRFQAIAAVHHASLGVGQEIAAEKGSFWALARTEMRISRLPAAGERAFLDTWVGRQSHGLFWRHYRIAGENGEALLYAVSIWVIMDTESRALTRDHAWAVVPCTAVEGELPSVFRPIPFPRELPEHLRRRVTDAETDGNGHLNNCLYLRWGQDLLPEEFMRTHTLHSVWIEYRKELPRGTESELTYSLGGSTLYVRGTAENKERFLLRMEYDETV